MQKTPDKNPVNVLQSRYEYIRDNGHTDFMEKADKCTAYTVGKQWTRAAKEQLSKEGRPALTINKILPSVQMLLGEHLRQRAEITFKPRTPVIEDISNTLSYLIDSILYNNQFDKLEADIFLEGIVTSRGFYDLRLDFTDSLTGEARITALPAKNVLLDPEAEFYDPDTWKEVFVTRWVNHADLALLYGQKKADEVYTTSTINDPTLVFDYYRDNIDGFGNQGSNASSFASNSQAYSDKIQRTVRLIERQHKQLFMQPTFVDPATGDMRPVPAEWSPERIQEAVQLLGYIVIKRRVERIRWTVIAGGTLLHDDWSPYKHFTVIPYFPLLLHGNTVGVVENLLDPQNLLNKISSQELHVVNTTANSGWIMKAGNLINMSISQLEQRGAETGLVLEVNDLNGVDKIKPNPVPSGLDRLSFKAEEHIKSISNISDSMMGQDREDVSGNAIRMKQTRGAITFAKLFDSLNYSRRLLARNLLDLIQEFYTDPRVYRVVTDQARGTAQDIQVNQPDPVTGQLLNNLTLGEYDVIIASQPSREIQEDNEFEEAARLKEMGVAIPDEVLIEASRFRRKREILEKMKAQQESPEAQQQQQQEQQARQLEIQKLQIENERLKSEIALKLASTEAKKAEALQSSSDYDLRKEREKAMYAAELQKSKQDHEAKMAQEQNALAAIIKDAEMQQAREQDAAAKATSANKKGDE